MSFCVEADYSTCVLFGVEWGELEVSNSVSLAAEHAETSGFFHLPERDLLGESRGVRISVLSVVKENRFSRFGRDYNAYKDSLPQIDTDCRCLARRHDFLNQSVRIRETCTEPVEVSVAEVFGFPVKNDRARKYQPVLLDIPSESLQHE